MTDPRKVRGLMGIAEAEAEGEAWELDVPSPSYVPGIGLGATKEATRWAWMGYNLEIILRIKRDLQRKRGRPSKHPFATKDAFRAFTLWGLAQRLPCEARKSITNRILICLAMKVEGELSIPVSERAFPGAGNFEQSVSRGKKALEIDDTWKSEVCEKIAKF